MTDWQARVAAKLHANRAAKAGKCASCGDPVLFPCVSVTRDRGEIEQCFKCWWEPKVATGDDKWWLKPEFGGKGDSRKRRSQR